MTASRSGALPQIRPLERQHSRQQVLDRTRVMLCSGRRWVCCSRRSFMSAGAIVSSAQAQFGRWCTCGHMQMTRMGIRQQGNELAGDMSNCATPAESRHASGLPCIAAAMLQAPPARLVIGHPNRRDCLPCTCVRRKRRAAGRRHSGGRTWRRSCSWRSTPTPRRRWRPRPQGPAPARPPPLTCSTAMASPPPSPPSP